MPFEVTTETKKLSFRGLSFPLEILQKVLSLRNQGVNPFAASLLWYDHDSWMEGPNETWSFFVVHDDKIVRECVIQRPPRQRLRPFRFYGCDDSVPRWCNDEASEEARARFWYRKFYSESREGQLMVLRGDEKKLYDVPSTKGPDVAAENSVKVVSLLNKIHVVLWLLVVLAGLILLRFWK